MKRSWEWCGIASVTGHKHCRWRGCDCPCHLPIGYTNQRRPHGVNRARWNRLGDGGRTRLIREREMSRRDRAERDAQGTSLTPTTPS